VPKNQPSSKIDNNHTKSTGRKAFQKRRRRFVTLKALMTTHRCCQRAGSIVRHRIARVVRNNNQNVVTFVFDSCLAYRERAYICRGEMDIHSRKSGDSGNFHYAYRESPISCSLPFYILYQHLSFY
jgi:hypothetical protein